MPKVNFSGVPDPGEGGFTPVPPGVYLAKIRDVNVKETQHKDEMWALTFELLEGPEGAPIDCSRRLVWDNIVWSDKALPRAKLILSRLGFDVERDEDFDWQPDHVKGRLARLELEIEVGQNGKERNTVPFAGYLDLDEREFHQSDNQPASIANDEDIPF